MSWWEQVKRFLHPEPAMPRIDAAAALLDEAIARQDAVVERILVANQAAMSIAREAREGETHHDGYDDSRPRS